MLQPKRTKFRKMMKGRNRGLAHRGSKVDFGEYGLKAISRGRLTARQIEAEKRKRSSSRHRNGESNNTEQSTNPAYMLSLIHI